MDPDGAAKRRQHAEREEARVRFWRDNGGACALAAFGLPTDAALAANDAINDRAAAYKAAKLRPGARMDQLRVLAFLDLLNGITLQARIAHDRADASRAGQRRRRCTASTATSPARAAGRRPGDGSRRRRGDGGRHATRRRQRHAGGGPDQCGDVHGDAVRQHSGRTVTAAPATGMVTAAPLAAATTVRRPRRQPGSRCRAPVLPALTARANLTLPLATLLGLAERPGAGHGLGPLDPALVRDLAATAAASPHSHWCLTITDSQGVAVAHGCAKPARTKKNRPASRDGPPRWAFTPTDDPGPPGGYGTWTLTLPGGRELTVRARARSRSTGCDHRHESHGYQPNDTLRHLVQVRDGTCTFPPCSRHARESDFEHAVPYDQGRPDLRLQRRRPQPSLPPGQAVTRLDRHPAPARLAPVDHTQRTHLHPRTHAVPGVISAAPQPLVRETWRMHAVVSTVRIEDVRAARQGLADHRVSLVPRAPGFVSAYWLAPVDGIGMSVIVFDTREHADEAVRYPVPPLPGVTPLTVDVREVYASA